MPVQEQKPKVLLVDALSAINTLAVVVMALDREKETKAKRARTKENPKKVRTRAKIDLTKVNRKAILKESQSFLYHPLYRL